MQSILKSFNKYELVATIIVFLTVGVGCVLSFTHPDFFRYQYTIEDGLLESTTVLFLLFGSFTCYKRMFHLRKEKGTLFLVCTFFLGSLYFFGAGEEISWGQRIFNIQSNEFFKAHNTQGEITLHNLSFTNSDGEKVKINKLIFSKVLTTCIIIYMLILPFLYRKKEKVKKLINKFAIPLPQNRHIILYIILAAMVLSLSHKKKGELLEFGGCCLFLMVTLYPLNKYNFVKKDEA